VFSTHLDIFLFGPRALPLTSVCAHPFQVCPSLDLLLPLFPLLRARISVHHPLLDHLYFSVREAGSSLIRLFTSILSRVWVRTQNRGNPREIFDAGRTSIETRDRGHYCAPNLRHVSLSANFRIFRPAETFNLLRSPRAHDCPRPGCRAIIVSSCSNIQLLCPVSLECEIYHQSLALS